MRAGPEHLPPRAQRAVEHVIVAEGGRRNMHRAREFFLSWPLLPLLVSTWAAAVSAAPVPSLFAAVVPDADPQRSAQLAMREVLVRLRGSWTDRRCGPRSRPPGAACGIRIDRWCGWCCRHWAAPQPMICARS